MKLLPDTHVLLWAAAPKTAPAKLAGAERWLLDPEAQVLFSAVSIWEVAIKAARGAADFVVDAGELRASLLQRGWSEIAVTGVHASVTATLPMLHKDPFDRLLLAQAMQEDALLVTGDQTLASYPGPILRV